MDQLENKVWPTVLVVGLIGFSFWWLNRSWETGASVESAQVEIYEMPRPQNQEIDYDLSQRQSKYTFQGLNKKSPETIGKVNGTKPPQTGAKAAQAKKADPKKTAQKRRPRMGVEIIAGKNSWSIQEAAPTESEELTNFPEPAKKKENQSPEKKKEDVLTVAEWRSLLMNSPTAENAYRFYKAYRSSEVSQDEFYEIAQELFGDSSAERQKCALVLLRYDFSVKGFTLLVSQYTDQTPEEMKKEIYAVMKLYGDLPRFSVLSRLLYSPNERVVAMATQVLTNSVNNQTQAQGGGTRPPASASIPPSSFRTFLPVLQRLAQSDNSSIAAQAQQLLESIQNLLTA